tara:strand:- start:464 stop:1828 length:1365 start_codon:yes stop_codon:yes gene_type:complete
VAAEDELKIPPHSIDAEQSVLGGLMLQNEAWETISDIIDSTDFYRAAHSKIYSAIQNLSLEDNPFDVITLGEWLDNRQELEKVGGMGYLSNLVQNTPSAANIDAYARVVRQKSVLRELINAASTITESAFRTEGRSQEELLGEAESLVFKIAEREERGTKSYEGMKGLLDSALHRVQELFENGGKPTGVQTGFHKLDDMINGLQPSDLVIVAGRPSMGKTAFAMNIARSAAIKQHVPVVIFSMEMPKEQIAMRMLASLARVDQKKISTGKVAAADWPRLTSAVQLLDENVNLFIDDTPALNPNEIRSRCRRLKRDQGLGLVVIDYLQLMQVSRATENRATEIAEISRSLKALAREIGCPIIALSQLNRALELRQDKTPMMSDLRESGAIEQDADLIMFIYREEVYDEETEKKGLADIIIGKHRNGPTGKVELRFRGEHTNFENKAPEYREGESE